jgi:CRISPR-associated DxTHG motif protein
MLVLLSTAGLGQYEEVVYSWAPADQRPQEYRTAFFQAAANAIFRPDKVFLMATSEALAHENCKRVQKEIGEHLELVPIPRGSSEEELWRIFDTVSSIVPEGARIILDVTHAFRSLPLLLFGVVTYLRRVKDTKLELIVYGAYEASESGLDGVVRVPVFDLTVLADLQEWLQALDAFAIRSDADKLTGLLKIAHRRPWVAGKSENQILPRRLDEMARHLGAFSNSVRLLRPLEALQEAAAVKSLAKEVEEEAAQWAKPFSHILSTLSDEISNMATDAPKRLDAECMRRQLALIDHYVSKDLVVQAVLLGREWLVNWLAWRTGHTNWLDSEVRLEMETGLNAGANNLRDRNTPVPSWYSNLVQAGEAANLWNCIRQLRNDVAHCAMNVNAASPASIKGRVQELVPRMEHLLVHDD